MGRIFLWRQSGSMVPIAQSANSPHPRPSKQNGHAIRCCGPCQNSILFAITRYPPHKPGSGICLSRNLCFILSKFDCNIDLEENDLTRLLQPGSNLVLFRTSCKELQRFLAGNFHGPYLKSAPGAPISAKETAAPPASFSAICCAFFVS